MACIIILEVIMGPTPRRSRFRRRFFRRSARVCLGVGDLICINTNWGAAVHGGEAVLGCRVLGCRVRRCEALLSGAVGAVRYPWYLGTLPILIPCILLCHQQAARAWIGRILPLFWDAQHSILCVSWPRR